MVIYFLFLFTHPEAQRASSRITFLDLKFFHIIKNNSFHQLRSTSFFFHSSQTKVLVLYTFAHYLAHGACVAEIFILASCKKAK